MSHKRKPMWIYLYRYVNGYCVYDRTFPVTAKYAADERIAYYKEKGIESVYVIGYTIKNALY